MTLKTWDFRGVFKVDFEGVFKRVFKGDLDVGGAPEGELKGELEVDLEGDFRGDFRGSIYQYHVNQTCLLVRN